MVALEQAEADVVETPHWGGTAPAPAALRVSLGSPVRVRDCFALDSPGATAAYWGAVALVVAGLFVTHLLPCVDYPQHLALSDVARRLTDPSAPEHAQYQLNYFTYNGLFHFVVAGLSRVLPIELVGRLVVGTSLAAMAAAVLALGARVLRRPPAHAALFTPILFSFLGRVGACVNYVMATAITAWALVFVARAAMRPSWLASGAVAVLGLACAFAHVLAMLILCLAAAALALEVAWRSSAGERGWRRPARTLFATLFAAAPLLLGCALCIQVYREQYDWDPNMYRDPTIEGSAPPLVQKAVWFGAFATDLYRDASDQLLLWLAIGIMGWCAMMAYKQRRSWDAPREKTPAIVLPFVVFLLAYFATPMVLVGTHLIFPRLAQWAIFGAALATPIHLDTAKAARTRVWMLAIGLAVGVNTVIHCALFDWETKDASLLIDDLPSGGAATAVVWDPRTMAFRNGTLTHLAAYYGARKHGRWAFAFARYLSVPVRFKPGSQPAWPARGWEFSGEDYDPRCKYARAFPLVLVKAPAEISPEASGEPAVRTLVFKRDADASPRLLLAPRAVLGVRHDGDAGRRHVLSGRAAGLRAPDGTAMIVKVLYFAALRDAVGLAEESLDLPPNASPRWVGLRRPPRRAPSRLRGASWPRAHRAQRGVRQRRRDDRRRRRHRAHPPRRGRLTRPRSLISPSPRRRR